MKVFMNFQTKPTAEQRRNASVAASDVDDKVFILWGIPEFFSPSALVDLLVVTADNIVPPSIKVTGFQELP